jgi:hypothetical protein
MNKLTPFTLYSTLAIHDTMRCLPLSPDSGKASLSRRERKRGSLASFQLPREQREAPAAQAALAP